MRLVMLVSGILVAAVLIFAATIVAGESRARRRRSGCLGRHDHGDGSLERRPADRR